jgi:copper chaperone CopZ
MTAARHTPRITSVLLVAALASCASTQSDGTGTGQETQGGSPATAPAPPPSSPLAETPRSEWPPNYETLRIKVSGMTCPFKCVREVKEMLRAVPGVLHVTVDYDEREADVDVTPGTDPQSVVRGLTGGYTGRLIL